MTLTCARCHNPLPEDQRCGSADYPLHPDCWMIDFYDFPKDKLKRLLADLDRARAKGLSEADARKMYWGALCRWRDKRVAEIAVINRPKVAYVTAIAEQMVAEGKLTRKEEGGFVGYEFPVSDQETLDRLIGAIGDAFGIRKPQ